MEWFKDYITYKVFKKISFSPSTKPTLKKNLKENDIKYFKDCIKRNKEDGRKIDDIELMIVFLGEKLIDISNWCGISTEKEKKSLK